MKLEDLKVGQYVRFKDKRGNTYIRNIKEVCNKQPHKSWGAIIIDKNANNVPYVSLKNIIKASYNIIDILEVGDYVNGSEVLDFEYKLIKGNDKFTNFAVVTENCYLENTDSWIIEKNIKSIVTHEQMEQMAYKVGE